MSKNKNDFGISTFFIGVYIMILMNFIRSFYWCLPILLIWNKIIVKLTDFSSMTYWNSYWICVVAMSLVYASISIKSK